MYIHTLDKQKVKDVMGAPTPPPQKKCDQTTNKTSGKKNEERKKIKIYKCILDYLLCFNVFLMPTPPPSKNFYTLIKKIWIDPRPPEPI